MEVTVKHVKAKNSINLTFKNLTVGEVLAMLNSLRCWQEEGNSSIAGDLRAFLESALKEGGFDSIVMMSGSTSDIGE